MENAVSSEFSCDYCSACPRNPCDSRAEAAHCPNAGESSGFYLDFDRDDVMAWLRYHSESLKTEDQDAISRACEIIERERF
jgi:hypothetical protein